MTGDKFGMTTLAPAFNPNSLPIGLIVPNAVVAGIKAYGNIKRNIEIIFKVRSRLPVGNVLKGVSLCVMYVPMPIISGLSICKNLKSSRRFSGV